MSFFQTIVFFSATLAGVFFSSCEKNKDRFDFSFEEIQLVNQGGENDKMRILNFEIFADSIELRKNSADITDFSSPVLKKLMLRMLKTVTDPENPGVGLAAPQVGVKRKIIWVQRYDKPGRPFECYLNAKITQYADSFKWKPDGCLSIPSLSGNSLRAIWVMVDYYKPDGTHLQEKIKHEFTAHIFQHEIDHLSGIVWLDRKSAPQGAVILN